MDEYLLKKHVQTARLIDINIEQLRTTTLENPCREEQLLFLTQLKEDMWKDSEHTRNANDLLRIELSHITTFAQKEIQENKESIVDKKMIAFKKGREAPMNIMVAGFNKEIAALKEQHTVAVQTLVYDYDKQLHSMADKSMIAIKDRTSRHQHSMLSIQSHINALEYTLLSLKNG